VGEQADHVGKRRLVAMMPVGPLGCIGIEMALVALGIGASSSALPDAVPAAASAMLVLLHAPPTEWPPAVSI
jgi:hypothetical protein